MNALQDLIVGLLKGDSEEMAKGVLAIGTGSANTDRNKLKEDLEYFSAKYMNVSSLNDIDFSALLGEVVDLADKHHIVMPGRFTMLVRSFLTIEGVMEQLCPELNMFDVISNKLMDRMKKSFSLKKEILSLGEGVLDVGKKVSRIPQLIADTLSDIMKGRLKVNLELTGYEDLINELNNKINDLILVIVGCVLFSGGCRLCQTQIKPMTPNGMPLIAAIILVLGISLILFAIKRIFRKK
jgi:ubiquinone biosynthesis protein